VFVYAGDIENELNQFFHYKVDCTVRTVLQNNVHEICITRRLAQKLEPLGHVDFCDYCYLVYLMRRFPLYLVFNTVDEYMKPVKASSCTL